MTLASAATPGSEFTFPAAYHWLAACGAQPGSAGQFHFGNPESEAAAALTGDVLAALTDTGHLLAQGADTDAFLQGQLSNDIRELTHSHALFASYNSAKGRALALPVLIRHDDGIWIELPNDLLDSTLKRLKMFVLRSKVTLARADVAALGVAGPNAAARLAAAGLPAPEQPWSCLDAEGLTVLRRPGDGARYVVYGSAEAISARWPALARDATPAGSHAWRLLELLAGIPIVHEASREQHVPQMLNLDQLGAISFTKGCYPGQEIVARLHYLGNLKRRLFVYSGAVSPPTAGTPVYAADGGEQAVGEVLDAQPHPELGCALQIVLQLSHQGAALQLGAPDGPTLKPQR